ncbi:MAG: nucleotidyltransferase family protein, partial [Lachnospiraceae bacterium]
GYCPYIRVLGFRRKQQHILSLLKKQENFPIIIFRI